MSVIDRDIEAARRENVQLFRKDNPLGDDVSVNTHTNHSVDMIMLGYLQYIPEAKALKVTPAGEARFKQAQKAKNRANKAKSVFTR